MGSIFKFGGQRGCKGAYFSRDAQSLALCAPFVITRTMVRAREPADLALGPNVSVMTEGPWSSATSVPSLERPTWPPVSRPQGDITSAFCQEPRVVSEIWRKPLSAWWITKQVYYVRCSIFTPVRAQGNIVKLCLSSIWEASKCSHISLRKSLIVAHCYALSP